MTKPANTQKSGKRGGKTRTSWKPGQSGNSTGRPKDGESWSSIISQIGNMYPEEILDFIGKDNDLGKAIAHFPRSVQNKYLVVLRVYASLMFEPSPGLFKEFLDRLEGKVPDHIDMTSKGESLSNLSDEQKILRIMALIQKAQNVESK